MKLWVKALLVLVVVVISWKVWPYFKSPQAQAEACHAELFDLASGRNWLDVQALMSQQYQDEWGNNAAQAVEIASDVLSGFLVLDLQWQSTDVKVIGDDVVEITGDCHIEGSGAGYIQTVKDRMNRLQQPWTFRWKKEASGPNGWRLIKLSNPELKDISPSSF